MRLRFFSRARHWTVLPGLALAVASGTALAQEGPAGAVEQAGFKRWKTAAPPCVTPCPCPAPQLIQPPAAQPVVPTQPSPTQPTQPQTPTTPQQPAQTPQQPNVNVPQTPEPGADQQFGATTGENTAFAPNIIGDLLFGSRSVSFPYLRASGPTNVFSFGSASVVNPSVAENNSPVPRDRAYFRFNYFDNALAVTGLGPTTIFAPSGIGTAVPATKFYSVEQYTFGFEKTFFNRRASFEMRMPFLTTLSPHQTLSTGDIAGPIPGTDANGNPLFAVTPTPGNTLGSSQTVWGNMDLILKGIVFQRRNFLFSGGAAMLVPTGPDQSYRIIDYASTAASLAASGQRERDIHINNSTWALSPFVAFLAQPSNRMFVQGFYQIDVPLNSSHITYSDRFTRGAFGFDPALTPIGPNQPSPFTVGRDIVEQPLMHVNLGTGYWLYQNQNANWLRAFAPLLELHYTTTLRNANIVQLPGDGAVDAVPIGTPGSIPVPGSVPPTAQRAEPGPQVGNLRNRVDILNLTVGSAAVIGDSSTLASGFVFPLRSGDDRVFNWEFQLQYNYYFGASKPRVAVAPNFVPNY